MHKLTSAVTVAILAALAIVPTSAFASTATVTSSTTRSKVTYSAGAGEANAATLATAPVSKRQAGLGQNAVSISDPNARITPGAGCSATGRHSVICVGPNLTTLVVFASDKGDTVVNNTALRSYANGGPGTDRLVGGSSRDVLRGDEDFDTLSGRGGNDRISTRGRWADRVTCGVGIDTVVADLSDLVAKDCENVALP